MARLQNGIADKAFLSLLGFRDIMVRGGCHLERAPFEQGRDLTKLAGIMRCKHKVRFGENTMWGCHARLRTRARTRRERRCPAM